MINQRKQLIPILLILALFSINFSGVCSTKPDVNNSDTTSINVKKAYKLIKENAGNPIFVILDVRKSDDFIKEHIASAINIDFKSDDFSAKLDSLDKSKTYLINCYGGFRSRNTMGLMEKKGFVKLYNMKGGIIKWRARKLPLVSN
jgi:rhodanese-related sulfurtransferase